MVRLTVELINDSLQYLNTVRDRELSLRACKIPVLENLGVTKDQFDTIDLTDNDIKKLENIPLLRRLSTLLMHNNRVQHIMPNIGEVLPSLKTLALTNNNLCELGDIDPLATCSKLEYLTLIGNPITHKPQYRLYVIYRVPSVRVLDFKRVRLAERKQANNLFKGKKGQKFREEVVKKSKTIPDDEDGQPRNLHVEDAKKIEEAIASASSLVEVERLQAILQSGRIPESGWNRESIGNIAENAEKDTKESNGFVAEQEDGDDDVRSPIANPAADDDVNDDVQSPVASPPHEEELDNGQME
ncbi:U2 small nuclear ribonucleoprotein A, putative [Brugia malayi]|uniref:Probable U2 small nuclear ribonucleoprotein A' n=1 Tax=Brugia malayi TaxID=6279 RepID=A0A0K0IZD7_BRUMA|nr:U2 small nuclear ribonucleoprotein A, putative [Brugia malayi]CTP80841.1 BMA-MOG-2 [Brugia malayi]VIO92964.1 U2 small nuclear ribonucleoprotein A, putative [Brugia malayi]